MLYLKQKLYFGLLGILLFSFQALAAPLALTPKGYIPERSPLFTWSAELGDVSYHFVLAEGAAVIYENANVTETSFKLPDTVVLQYGTMYTWRVRALSSSGVHSAFSNYWNFITYDPNFVPQPLAPISYVASSKPVFSWSAPTDAVKYILYAYEEGTGAVVVHKELSTNSYSAIEGQFAVDRIYLWKVQAVDAAGGKSQWSPISGFLIYYNAFAPTLGSPSGDIFETRPLFTWEPVTGVIAYELEILRGSQIIYQAASGGTSLTLADGFNLQVGETYSWRMRSINSRVQVSMWSAPTNFTVLAKPILAGPAPAIAQINAKVGSPAASPPQQSGRTTIRKPGTK